jgi:hypothetical protein
MGITTTVASHSNKKYGAVLRGTVVLATAIALSGCVQFGPIDPYDGPVAIRRASDGLEIAICDDILAQKFIASERNESLGVDWERFIDSGGEAKLLNGDIVSPETIPEGLVATGSVQPSMKPGSQINVLVVGEDMSISALLTISDSGLDTDEWLHPDGSLSAAACG